MVQIYNKEIIFKNRIEYASKICIYSLDILNVFCSFRTSEVTDFD